MATTTMSTVDKALSLLRHFSVQKSELGLSELARLANFDKTTTLRCMTALERNGFVEQDEQSRKYRLGLAPINLAQIRERSFPVNGVIKRYLDDLAQTYGETAHASLFVGKDLVTAAISEPDRALRVHVDPSEILPWHATASGIAVSAYLPAEDQEHLLSQRDLQTFTRSTPTEVDALRDAWSLCLTQGISRAEETFEKDVVGTAAPIFGPSGRPMGAVAVASVSLRMTSDLQVQLDAALRGAARSITHELGGKPPALQPGSVLPST